MHQTKARKTGRGVGVDIVGESSLSSGRPPRPRLKVRTTSAPPVPNNSDRPCMFPRSSQRISPRYEVQLRASDERRTLQVGDRGAIAHIGGDPLVSDQRANWLQFVETRTKAPLCANRMRQVVLAVVGTPHAGKSTFIQHALDLREPPSSKISTKKVSLEGAVSVLQVHELNTHDMEIKCDGTPHWPQDSPICAANYFDGAIVIYSVKDIASTVQIPAVLRTPVSCISPKRPRAWSDIKDLESPSGPKTLEAKKRHQRAVFQFPMKTAEVNRDRWLEEERYAGEVPDDLSDESIYSKTDSTGFTDDNEGRQLPLRIATEGLHLKSRDLDSSTSTSLDTLDTQALSTVPDAIDRSDTLWQSPSHDKQRVAQSDITPPVGNETAGVAFDELVNRLLSQATSKIYVKFAAMFLCLYRRFRAPSVLLDAIILRFENVGLETSHQTTRITSRLRHLSILAQWITDYPGDFAHSLTRLKLANFISELTGQRPFAIAIQEVSHRLNEVCENADTVWACSDANEDEPSITERFGSKPSSRNPFLDAQISIVEGMGEVKSGDKASHATKRDSARSFVSSGMDKPSSHRTMTSQRLPNSLEIAQTQARLLTSASSTNLCKFHWHLFMDLSDEDIAQELTRIDWALLSSIRPRDLVRHVSLSEKEKEECTSLRYLSRMIYQFNHVAFWIANLILLREKPKHRAKALQNLLAEGITQKLRQLNNYNSLGAVVAGINGTAVHRLTQTWELIQHHVQKQFMRLEILMGTQKSHFAYRLAWSNTRMERIPFLPLHCRDLASAEEGNPTYLDEQCNLINWKKFEVIGDVIFSIQRSQALPYQFPPRKDEAHRLILDSRFSKDDDVGAPRNDVAILVDTISRTPMLAGLPASSSVYPPGVTVYKGDDFRVLPTIHHGPSAALPCIAPIWLYKRQRIKRSLYGCPGHQIVSSGFLQQGLFFFAHPSYQIAFSGSALKFLPSRQILPQKLSSPFLEYLSPRSTLAPPYPSRLAARLFNVDGINSIFYGPDFITITKAADANWAHIKPEVFSLITEAMNSAEPIVNTSADKSSLGGEHESAPDSLAYNEQDSEVVGMIKELLETRIRPAIQDDGGDVDYCGFEGGKVLLKLRGACRTCDSSTVTLKNGIESMLMHYIEEVKGVTQVLDEAELTSNAEFARFEEKLQKSRGLNAHQPTTEKGARDSAELAIHYATYYALMPTTGSGTILQQLQYCRRPDVPKKKKLVLGRLQSSWTPQVVLLREIHRQESEIYDRISWPSCRCIDVTFPSSLTDAVILIWKILTQTPAAVGSGLPLYMASTTPSQSNVSQRKRTSVSGYPGNASIFLEKAKVGKRGSTPDSEALASSDDEQEHHYRIQSIANIQGSRPVRRASWLNEINQAPQRKGSLGGGGAFPSNASHPPTPSNEHTPWAAAAAVATSGGSSTGRGHPSSTSIPWGSAIWSSDTQKGLPSRLTEVLPSPTTLVPPASAGSLSEEPLLSPTYSRESNAESAIPFAIPLHPTLKTYRSQSYSVGQLDPESASAIPNNQTGHAFNHRSRSGVSYSGLQHRPSRPSMLGDPSHDVALLGKLREVEDDDESSTGSEAGVQLSSTQARTIEQLAMENAILRQAAAEQIENARGRHRASNTDSKAKVSRPMTSNYRVHDSLPEETDHGYDEQAGMRIGHSCSNEGLRARRSSEYATNPPTQYAMAGIPEHRNLESFKKGHWQSSLGFGGIAEPPQSRRHSFAEVPTRQTSIGSFNEHKNGQKADQGSKSNAGHSGVLGYTEGVTRQSQGDGSEYAHFRSRQHFEENQLELEHLRDRKFAASYFSGIDQSLRNDDSYGMSVSPAASYQSYPPNHSYMRPQHLGPNQLRVNQLLYVVTFKACRADIFYVSEGTGLQVKPGDLVIVEADRGTDLGTVAHENCSWARARELKDQYTEEHYKWLMMFSRHGQNSAASTHGLDGQHVQPHSPHTSVLGSAGAPTGLSNLQEPSNNELKPKMIKRLAQPHEVQTLREKEGNEAKAKRACQQKVVEHRLNMEILDAEFQMDWKKLTFYYFADSYVNFNPLVTDLFKIYKTRIWMSAINPASFASTATTLQSPSGLGTSAFLSEPGPGLDRRHYRSSPNLSTVGTSQAGYRAPGHVWEPSREIHSLTEVPLPNNFQQPLQTASYDVRHLSQYPTEHAQDGQQVLGLQPRYNPAVYNLSDMHNPLYVASLEAGDEAVRAPDIMGQEWTSSFQGLSLGS
ncbi:MAG: hypothetical protein Q9170_001579 [Blastenia crenularia]